MRSNYLKNSLLIILLVTLVFGLTSIKVVNAEESGETNISSEEDMIEHIYSNLLERNSEFTLTYNGSWDKIYHNNLDEIFGKVFKIDDKNTSDDFDYLKGDVKMYRLSAAGNSKMSKLTFTVKYRETKEQLNKVNEFVESSLKSLKLTKKSDYSKVKAIHDFIIKRTTYDSSYSKYTAYDAMNGSAVCQGYSLLFYKMATEAGIPCRYVTSSNHAWNIVKLDKKWYHIDLTWDDPISKKPVLQYTYFLFGSKNADSTHQLSSEYTTKSFTKNYPISKTNYTK